MIFLRERIGKLLAELQELSCEQRYPVTEYRMKRTKEKAADEGSQDTSGWEILSSRQIWGDVREHLYFETVFTVPGECAGKRLVYELRTGQNGAWDVRNPQFLVYVNGRARQGLDANHRELLLAQHAETGEQFRILLAAYTGDAPLPFFLGSDVKVVLPEVEAYYYDVRVPWEVAGLLDPESDEYITIIQCLNNSLNLLDLRRPYSAAFFESLQAAGKELTEQFYGKCCGHSAHTICCVGHTHIDVAWLWTLATTEDKVVRSFATVLEYMRRYPEYKFMSSQPQLYQYVKKNAPELYEEIRQRVKEGRWEAEGGMWVEADCNLASGEALVRQFLYGTRFFEREFGVKNEVLWLPDVFGYSAALPQIMKKCGISYFMTTKISWSEFNRMPYDTFLWEGIDGTEVLTHFAPARDFQAKTEEGGKVRPPHYTTYNAMLTPSQVKGSWKRYGQKALNDEVLMSYGYGDGGGGPTTEMLENQRRMALGIPGCPNTRQCHAAEFFHKLEQDTKGSRELPRWVGELYLEYHRGTYTSMARNKRYNRKAEFSCENLELYSTLARECAGFVYPKEALLASWEIVLRNQFHDILPGSAIKEVYEDSKEEYEKLFAVNRRLTGEALGCLADAVKGEAGDVVIFNPNSASQPVPVLIPADEYVGGRLSLVDAAGEYAQGGTVEGQMSPVRNSGRYVQEKTVEDQLSAVDTFGEYVQRRTVEGQMALVDASGDYVLQRTEDGLLAVIPPVPSKGWRTFSVRENSGRMKTQASNQIQAPVRAQAAIQGQPMLEQAVIQAQPQESMQTQPWITASCVDTPYFRVELNEKGQFASIYDKKNARELLKPGACGNVIVSYEDKPHNYDNWDINHYYKEKSWLVDEVSRIEVTEEGPVRGCIRVERPYLESVIVQYLYFYPALYRIDIRNEIDWREHHVLLRDYFPVDIHATEAVYDIQFGNVKRPAHYNTSWDFAKFEVCAHKWLDVSEDGYGVSILNDCKYGCDFHEGVIGLSMLKAGLYPNPDADKEHHTFWYSICPHSGDFRSGGTVAAAYLFNNPCQAVVKHSAGGSLPGSFSWVSADAENVVIEAVKQAEDSQDLIVRFYECWNRRTRAQLTFAVPFAAAYECNMLEREETPVRVDGCKVTVELRPYEIKTLRISAKQTAGAGLGLRRPQNEQHI